jgi:uncharacterized membrane protein YccC
VTKTPDLIGLIVGAASITATISISVWLGAQNSLLTWGIGAGVFLVAGFSCALLFPRASWSFPPLVLCGLAIPIFVEAMIAEYFRNQSRNLWPIDIFVWSLIAACPLYLGFAVGRRIDRSRRGTKAS